MTRAILIVRLLAAVVVSLASCKLVNVYAQISYIRLKFDHAADVDWLTPINAFVLCNGGYVYAFPCALLLVGMAIIWRSRKANVWGDLVCSMLWIFAFVWFGFTILAWQVQNVPIFHGMRAHY
jgi:hypothetical protein